MKPSAISNQSFSLDFMKFMNSFIQRSLDLVQHADISLLGHRTDRADQSREWTWRSEKYHLHPLKHHIPYLTTSAERDLYRQIHNRNSGVVFQLISHDYCALPYTREGIRGTEFSVRSKT